MRFPDTPPAVSNIPRRTPRFAGREAMLDDIGQTLFAAAEPRTAGSTAAGSSVPAESDRRSTKASGTMAKLRYLQIFAA